MCGNEKCSVCSSEKKQKKKGVGVGGAGRVGGGGGGGWRRQVSMKSGYSTPRHKSRRRLLITDRRFTVDHCNSR